MQRGYSRGTYTKLYKSAQNYAPNEIELFIAETGWEPEWMLDFIANPEEEMLSMDDIRAINGFLISVFEDAHGIEFSSDMRAFLLTF